MLQLGSSVSWKKAMETMNDDGAMDSSAFVEYFEPLAKWLKSENERTGVQVGWEIQDYGRFCRNEI